ncbi:MAG: histidine kinase [Clostridiales bacterium]|nr:histidine kinase [Clostridiales bacterium]
MKSDIIRTKNIVALFMILILGSFLFVCNIEAGSIEREAKYYVLLLLYSSIVFLHFAVDIMREESSLRKPLLIGLFAAYFILCLVSLHWTALLLLPYLLCYHKIIEIKQGFGRYLTLIILIAALLIFSFVGSNELRAINILITSAALVLNAVICFVLFFYFGNYLERLSDIEKIMSASSVNALTEKLFSNRLALQKDIEIQNARNKERETMSLNIHNVVGHAITSSIMTLEAAHILHDLCPDESMKKILIARDKMSEGLESIRQIVRIMDPENESAALSDLVSYMHLSAEEFISCTPLKLVHNLKDQPPDISVPKRHGEFITGALMELLTNASKTADITTITVLLTYSRAYLKLCVSDNGLSFISLSEEQKLSKLNDGFGLKNIEKYVRECGGAYQLKTTESFAVEITIPILEVNGNDR